MLSPIVVSINDYTNSGLQRTSWDNAPKQKKRIAHIVFYAVTNNYSPSLVEVKEVTTPADLPNWIAFYSLSL